MWQSRQLKGCTKLQASRLYTQAQRQPEGPERQPKASRLHKQPQRQPDGPQRQPKGRSKAAKRQLIHATCLHQ